MSEQKDIPDGAAVRQPVPSGDSPEETGQYRILFENMLQGAFCQNADGTLVDVNPSALAMLGLSRDDFLGKTSHDFKDTLVREDGTPVPVEEHPSMVALKSGKAVRDFIGGLRNVQSHELIWISIDALPQFRAGESAPYRVFVTWHDITERKRMYAALEASERRLRTLLESVPTVSVQGYGPDATVHFWNKASETVYGYAQEEAIGRNLVDLIIPPESRDEVRTAIRTMGETGVSLPASELSLMRKDGTRNHVLSSHVVVPMPGEPAELFCLDVDISELKRTQTELEEARQHFANIIDFLPDATFVIDNDKKVIAWNRAMEEMTGVSKAEMIGQGDHAYTIPFYGVRRVQLLDLLDYNDQEIEAKYQNVRRRGDRLYAEAFAPALYGGKGAHIWMTGAPLFNLSGERVGAVEVIRDISELKRTEQALRSSAAKLLSIFKSAPTGIGMVVNRIITEVNDSLCRMSGYSHDELVGQSVRIFYRDEAEFQWVGAEKYRQMAERGTGTVETTWITKDGRSLNVMVSSTPINPSDVSEGITFIALDITERKHAEAALRRSEEKFAGAFRISPTVLTISEPATGRYIDVNDAFAKVFGYTRDEVIGRTSLELGIWLNPDDRASLYEALQLTGEIMGAACRMRSKDGKVHDMLIWAKILRYEDREDLLAIVEDVTEKKKLEAQLIQSQKMESVGRLAGGVAHDYNNMLAVIFFSLALIKNRLHSDDPAMESVLEIERAATRSRDITRQLLAFSRKQLIAPKPCDLNVLISDLEKSLTRLIGEDIELRVSLQQGLGQVLIDPSQVDQILVNLAVNARDAMPGGGKLSIETANSVLDEEYCSSHEEYCVPGSYVRLTLCDNGSGMDKETLEHIFEPFFTTKEIGKGTGLGLATVFGIVKQNAGFINAYSQPGEGTEFRIYLPRIQVPASEPELKKEADIATGSETILLVEDDEMLRRATKKTLEVLGYTVDEAAVPAEALELLEQRHADYDLLLTDVVMPGMNGAQLRDRIKAVSPGIKVLFMSGYTTDAIVCGEVLQDGIDFIQKPFSVRAFAEKIREVLDRSRH